VPAIDIFDIKAQNVKRIIDVIRLKKSMTKKEIADATSLSFATVSNLCNELVNIGVLASSKKGGMSVGRTPNDLTFSSEKFNTICINLQMKGIMNFAVLTLSHNVVFQRTYDISAINDVEQIIRYAKQILDKELPPNKNANCTFVGVGVAVSAIFDIEKGILINSAVDILTNVAMKNIVERIFGLPAYVDNEANLCALSVSQEEGKNANIVYLYLSQGVGVGVICQGRLFRGARGYAGEVAHMPIGDADMLCPTCGNYGCIENNLSVGGFLSKLYGTKKKYKLEDWNLFVRQLENGEKGALAIAEHNGILLGKLASVLVNLFDPSIFYIGGEIARIFNFMKKPFCEEFRSRILVMPGNELPIICDEYSDDTINVGISEELCNKWAATCATGAV